MNAPDPSTVSRAGDADTGAGGEAAACPLALVEILDRDGRVRQALPVWRAPVRIGRAIDNDIVLDDPHVAAHHALIEWPSAAAVEVATPGAAHEPAHLRVLPGLNGVLAGRRRHGAGARLALSTAAGAAGNDFTIGTTRLRVRLAGETLAPERALARPANHSGTLLIAAALWLWLVAEFWLNADPGVRATQWLLPLLGAPAAVGLWCGVWALASKLFQQRLDFRAHLAVAVRGLLAIEVAGLLLPLLAMTSGVALFSRLLGGVVAALGVAWLVAHVRLVLPHQRRALAVMGAAAYFAGAVIVVGLNQQRHERWFAELYTTTLPPPALHWTQPVAPEEFLQRARTLRAPLERNVREAEARDGDDEE